MTTPMETRLEELKRIAANQAPDDVELSPDTVLKLIESLGLAMKGLENCTGGDLASGEGIYKAEIADEALTEIQKLWEK